MGTALTEPDLTVDQLAQRVGMTVRNVRAYAGRGLIPAPRLVGRTGYYSEEHAARLGLIRDLIDRGYTLGAVEKAIAARPDLPHSHALDLLDLLSHPLGHEEEPEDLLLEDLTALAGVEHDDAFIREIESLGLVHRVDEETVRLLRPVIVRAGASALSLGLSREQVLGLFEAITTSMSSLAARFVDAFRADVWRPFLDAGMPESEWPGIVSSIERLLPVVSQATLASFRFELTGAIENAMGEEMSALTGEQIDQLLGGP